MTWRIGVDIGGTFTDLVAVRVEDGALIAEKTLTNSEQPVVAVLEVLALAKVSLDEAASFVHGSTLAINLITEGGGARTALLTTRGFRDVLEMGRKNRPDMYNLSFERRKCLVPRELRYEVDERRSADGQVVTPLDVERLVQSVSTLPDDVESVAISFLHSCVDDAHEQQAAAIVSRERPDMYVTVSSDVSGEAGEYERTSTAVANSYVGPVVNRYVSKLADELDQRGLRSPLLITQSNGGVMSAATAVRQPIRTTESGPAAGVNGAAWLGQALGITNLIAFDMGGTTAKACVVQNGRPEMSSEYYIGGRLSGVPVRVPFIDIVEVGAGGGSIGHRGADGSLRVGPRSAGANPGPACYALGGNEPTVTDANLLVGKIGGGGLLGGRLQLDATASEAAVLHLASNVSMDVRACANGLIRIANQIMASAIRAVTIERGRDPRELPLVAYGGAGPLHAVELAAALGIPQIVVPAFSGTFAAHGMLTTDIRHDVARSVTGRLTGADSGKLDKLYKDLEAETLGVIVGLTEHDADPETELTRYLDLRYIGQYHTLTVPLPPGPIDAALGDLPRIFDEVHLLRYGHNAPGEEIELTSARVSGALRVPKPPLNVAPVTFADEHTPASRDVLFADGTTHECAILRRAELSPGTKVTGPALIEDTTTSVVVTAAAVAEVSDGGHLIVTLPGGE